jgi:hypothetical protein
MFVLAVIPSDTITTDKKIIVPAPGIPSPSCAHRLLQTVQVIKNHAVR